MELRRLFETNGVWRALMRGNYQCTPRDKVRRPVRPGSRPAGGYQVLHKWQDIFDRHTVTTHAVFDAEGWPVHWDEKDLVIGSVKYVHDPHLDP